MTGEKSERHLSIVIIGFLAYLSLPVVCGLLLYCGLELRMFPVGADSIMIPFAGFMLFWFGGLLSGIVAGLMLLASDC